MLIERTIQIDGSRVTITQRVETSGKGSQNKKLDKESIAILNQAGTSFHAAAETASDRTTGGGDGVKGDTGGGDGVKGDTGGGDGVKGDTGGQGVTAGAGDSIVIFGPIVINCAPRRKKGDSGGGDGVSGGTGGLDLP